MKVAVVYNRASNSVINLFGVPNREKYGLRSIKRITDALKGGGHQVIALEGDKDLIDRLEEFMPRVLKGERPGLVFNLSYGIQGQARYTHVPGILEMVGIPYVGSGPLAHSLALDKVVAKMVFRQHGLPTPDFAVLQPTGYEPPELEYPLIVKPRGEAVSFGLKIVNDPDELAAAAQTIFDAFGQSVLVERYIDGREINVGLLGNSPPEVLPPVELGFGEGGPAIYTYEDKTHRSGREITALCPAPIDDQQAARAKELARHAFDALGCSDCARVDMRMDAQGQLYILEINSLPSLGAGGSYVKAAAQIGLDFPALVNRLVEVASARYFGTPSPPRLERGRGDARSGVFQYLTERRDRIERRLSDWVAVDSRSGDAYGIHHAASLLDEQLRELGLQPLAELSDDRSVWCWQSAAGLDEGTLLVGHLDVPLPREMPVQRFRRDPEWLSGEGIGTSRAPLVMLQFALRALRHQRRLRRLPLGVLYYTDEGQQAQQSARLIRAAMKRAKRVLVLRPGNPGGYLLSRRRGLRSFQLKVEGRPRRLGASDRQRDPLYQLASRIPDPLLA